MENKVATLISGGLDSATVVAWAHHQGYDQRAFFVNYGQDNMDRELACAVKNTQRWDVPLEVVDIASLRKSFIGRFPFPINLYDCDVANPLGQITTFGLSVIVAGVAVLAGRDTLVMGIHHTDLELRPLLKKVLTSLEDVVNTIVTYYSDRTFRLLLPFAQMGRDAVVRTGIELGVPLEDTWSCHSKGDTPCGVCNGCRERAEAFEKAAIPDPALLLVQPALLGQEVR